MGLPGSFLNITGNIITITDLQISIAIKVKVYVSIFTNLENVIISRIVVLYNLVNIITQIDLQIQGTIIFKGYDSIKPSPS